MNIENRKLSGRQLGRMMFYDSFAVSSLLLPGILARRVGMDGFFALALGGFLGYLLLFLLLAVEKAMRKKGLSEKRFMRTVWGNIGICLVLLLYFLGSWFCVAYSLSLLCRISKQYLIRNVSDLLLLLLTAGLAVFGLWNGTESRGRKDELLFWFVVVPLGVFLILAAQNVNTDHWVPVFSVSMPLFLQQSCLVLLFFTGSLWLPILSEDIAPNADISRPVRQGYLFGLFINLVLFLLLTGIFGVPTIAAMNDAALALTAMVKIPGGFFERQDALLCGVWLISLFVFVEHAMYVMTWCGKKLLRIKGCKRTFFISGGLAVLLAVLLLQTGCGQLEIEDRAFPLALSITPAEAEGYYEFSFLFEEMDMEGSARYHKEDAVVTAKGYPQAFAMFGRVQPAGLDDSHMQVILLSEELLDDTGFLESFYGFFQKEHHFSWNTMVYLTDQASASVEELRESTGNRTGTYLRDMAQSDEQEKTAGVPTLGDLYMEWNNKEQILLLPVLSSTTPPFVDHYRLLVQGVKNRKLTMDEARMLQWMRGDLTSMQLELSKGEVLELKNIRWTVVSLSDKGAPQPAKKVILRVSCVLQNRPQPTKREKEKLLSEAEALLYERQETLLQVAPVKDERGQLVLPEYEIRLSWSE